MQSPGRDTAFLQASSINLNTEGPAWKASPLGWLPLPPLGPRDDIWGPLCPSGKRCRTGRRGQAAVAGEQVTAGGCAVQESPAGPADVQLFISSLLECKCQLPSSSPASPGHSCLHLPLQDPEGALGPSWAGRPSSTYSTAPQKRGEKLFKRMK